MSALWKGLALAVLGFGASVAQAGGINWSIGISLPPVSTVISNEPYHRPYYEPAPVYHVPPPVYHAPPPVYYAPPPVVYRPAPVYHVPPAVVYHPAPALIVERRWVSPRHEWRHHRGHDHGHDHHRWRKWDDRDDYRHHRRGRDH